MRFGKVRVDYNKWRRLTIPCLLVLLIIYVSKNLFDNGPDTVAKSTLEPVLPKSTTRISRSGNPDVYKHLHYYNPRLPTNLTQAVYETPEQTNQANIARKEMANYILSRFENKTGGFFIECGAYDGFFLSNTLMLEQDYGWTGLLVEADPEIYPILINRNRKAIVAAVGLSLKNETMKVKMGGKGLYALSVIENKVYGVNISTMERQFEANLVPLHMLLDEIGRDYVDYFSLDVEGVELDIMKTIPFDRIRIQLISAEHQPANRDQIKEFLESKGYTRINSIKNAYTHDDVYEYTK